MATPIIDAREIPVQWIVHEPRQVCGLRCLVDIQESAESLLNQDEEEVVQHSVEQSWWDAWRAYTRQLSLTASFPPFSADDVNCADHPLALGCDGLLLVLEAILAVLVAVKAATRASQ